MSRMSRKAAVALLSAAVVTGLATTGSAYAASDSVELTICNNTGKDALSVRPSGINQNGQAITGYGIEHDIRTGSCHKFGNWWWKKGNTITWNYIVVIGTNLGEARSGACWVASDFPSASAQCNL